MTYDYSKVAATALKQINDKGRSVTVRYPSSDDAYDPATDTFTSGDPVNVAAKGVFTSFQNKDIDGELIKRTDKRVLIAGTALDDVPNNDAKIIDGAKTYSVINTEVVQPAETVVLYMIQVRA